MTSNGATIPGDYEFQMTPADMHDYMVARRRALITELRAIEAALGMEQSIPKRLR